MLSRMLKSVVVCAIAGLAMGQAASAQNLVNNPGFETGDMTGWTVVHTGAFSGVDAGGATPHTGVHSFGMGAQSLADQTDFFQDIATVAGLMYTASFWARDLDSTSSGFIHVTIGGVDIGPASGVVPATYTQFTRTFTATSATTRLEATGWEVNLWVESDDYSVTALPAPTGAATLAMGLGFAGRRRRR